MTDTLIAAVYADGGEIEVNGSTIGITWACCHVNAAGKRIWTNQGVLLQADEPVKMGNNTAELLALVECLEALPAGWVGPVYTDSNNTIGRVWKSWAMRTGVPDWLKDRVVALRQSISIMSCTPILLDGHPTKAQVAAGIGKRGSPVSIHNVWCDRAATDAGRIVVNQMKKMGML